MRAINKKIESILHIIAVVALLFCLMPNVAGADDTQPAPQPAQVGTQATRPATQPATAATPDAKSVPVTEMEVTAEKEKAPREGSAEVGYKVENVTTTGPWGEMKLQDTPYTISVIPADLIENVQATSQDELAKMNPLIQFANLQNINNLASVQLRGFSQQYPAFDGLVNGGLGFGLFMEDIERIEVLAGSSGFLYGIGNVGGLLNYVYKRPTQEYLGNITLADYGSGTHQFYFHGDFGGPIPIVKGLAFRLNVVDNDGGTEVSQQSLTKQLISGALDYHITDNLLVQLNGGHEYWHVVGRQPTWGLASNVTSYPSAQDATKLWAPAWTYYASHTNYGEANLKWDISDLFAFRGAARYQEDIRQYASSQNILQSNGTWTMGLSGGGPQAYHNLSEYAYLDAKFNTGPIYHKVTMGFSGYDESVISDKSGTFSSTVSVTGLSLNNPNNFNVPEPTFNAFGGGGTYTSGETKTYNFMIGDDIRLTDKWSALVGLNLANDQAISYAATGAKSATPYHKVQPTPSASLIYKLDPSTSFYATYMEAVEQATIVPLTNGALPYSNAGQILTPLIDHQYEAGVKETLGRLLLTGALFRIDKSSYFNELNAAGTSYTEKSAGGQRDEGIEVTVTGKATDRLTLYGGFTIMKCSIENPTSAALNNTKPSSVADQFAKMYAEYDLPYVHGLTLTGGAYWTGREYESSGNVGPVPGYLLADLGVRYQTKIVAAPLIFRFNVDNVADRSYWTSGELGQSRTYLFSAELKF